MTMELRWLSAPDTEVAAAMATLRRDSRPKWVPNRRQVFVHINNCLILWYLCIVFLTFGIQVDVQHGGQPTASDIGGITVAMVILAVWLFGTVLLYRWSTRPPSPRARLRQWRQDLTALANGFEPESSPVATFSSLITRNRREVRAHPRFVAAGVEFGVLTTRTRRSTTWHYLAVSLPAPLPHLLLDATSNNGIGSDLPTGIAGAQRLSLEGDFDRWFHAYAPVTYGQDALYFLTPAVMTALIDDARQYNVEIIDSTLVFFTSSTIDFSDAAPWRSLQSILSGVAAPIVASARRYRDERVPGQEVPPVISRIEAELENPGVPWISPSPRIGPTGQRLAVRDRSTGIWPVLGAVGWFTLLTVLYAVPGIFAFAGLMSIIDGW